MANTESRFNPAYSTIKSIYLGNLDILRQNTECQFERLEIVENINDVLPSGALLVKDKQDIASAIELNAVTTLTIEFFNGNKWECDITSVSYSNNAASDTEETLLVINFTNHYYRYFSTNSLNKLLGYKSPQVYTVDEFVAQMVFTFGAGSGYRDSASNYFLYRPFIPFNSREEALPDNAIQMMNYLSTMAVDQNKNPNFFFWTSMNGAFNFKSFSREMVSGEDEEPVNVAVYNGDAVEERLSDGKQYRKAYFLATNPAYQWISKNYYYIRKTPKYLDTNNLTVPDGLSGDALSDAINAAQNNALKNLTFQFQDDGQKYNIDVVSVAGRATEAPSGGDLIYPEYSWGYYDGGTPTNDRSITNMLGNQYGMESSYGVLNLMGDKGYMAFLDSPDMWKNMFDLTPIHPHYPNENDTDATSATSIIPGESTNLQKVMDIRYNTFKALTTGNCGSSEFAGPSGPTGSSKIQNTIEQLRKIEQQNFVIHSLCCMGKRENCFFAVLQRYEPDTAYYGATGTGGTGGTGGNFQPQTETTPELPTGAKFYRYKWNKILFSSGISGACGSASGASGASGGSGNTYYPHLLEQWSLDPSEKSNDSQDATWAINLNERGLTGAYLPPGWSTSTLPGFLYRPIGAPAGSTFQESANIMHIARVCVEQIDPNNSVTYFWAENVVDGNC